MGGFWTMPVPAGVTQAAHAGVDGKVTKPSPPEVVVGTGVHAVDMHASEVGLSQVTRPGLVFTSVSTRVKTVLKKFRHTPEPHRRAERKPSLMAEVISAKVERKSDIDAARAARSVARRRATGQTLPVFSGMKYEQTQSEPERKSVEMVEMVSTSAEMM